MFALCVRSENRSGCGNRTLLKRFRARIVPVADRLREDTSQSGSSGSERLRFLIRGNLPQSWPSDRATVLQIPVSHMSSIGCTPTIVYRARRLTVYVPQNIRPNEKGVDITTNCRHI